MLTRRLLAYRQMTSGASKVHLTHISKEGTTEEWYWVRRTSGQRLRDCHSRKEWGNEVTAATVPQSFASPDEDGDEDGDADAPWSAAYAPAAHSAVYG